MYALIADVAVAGVPEPVPVVAEAKFVEGTTGRRPEEHVPVHAGRCGGICDVPDGGAALVAEAFGGINIADQTAVDGGHGFHLEGSTAMLRSDLHDALGFV